MIGRWYAPTDHRPGWNIHREHTNRTRLFKATWTPVGKFDNSIIWTAKILEDAMRFGVIWSKCSENGLLERRSVRSLWALSISAGTKWPAQNSQCRTVQSTLECVPRVVEVLQLFKCLCLHVWGFSGNRLNVPAEWLGSGKRKRKMFGSMFTSNLVVDAAPASASFPVFVWCEHLTPTKSACRCLAFWS